MIDWQNFPPGDHRIMCPACGKKPSTKDMGVTILEDGHGLAHCFKCRLVLNRRQERAISHAQRKVFARRVDALRRQHNAERQKRQADTAAAAGVRWTSASGEGAEWHPYLVAKGIQSHGARVEAGRTLLIPLQDVDGRLHSVQGIDPDGSKRFMPGGRVKGCFFFLGEPSGRVAICEGFATGATIRENTGVAVAVAFNSGNLLPVAEALRAKHPGVTLVLAADDDWKTQGNPGLTAAIEAARAVDGLLAVPDFGDLPRGDKDTDFNDLHRLAAALEVQA